MAGASLALCATSANNYLGIRMKHEKRISLRLPRDLVARLDTIVAISIGGAITRSRKAGAVVGFLAVWIPTFAFLILLLALGDSDAGFAVIVATSLYLGAWGVLIGLGFAILGTAEYALAWTNGRERHG